MLKKIFSDPKILMDLKRNDLPLNEDGLTKLNEIHKENLEQLEYIDKKAKITKLSEDIVQFSAGIAVENIKEKKNEFLQILNDVRKFEGKNNKRFY